MAIVVGIGWVLFKLKIADQKLAFRIRTGWCKLALKILGIRLHKTGKIDLTEGTLYVGNHRSLIDPLVAFCFIDHGYAVSKIEVSTYPLVHTGATLSGVIYVERTNSQSRSNTKEVIEQSLKDNKSILIFPEGTTGTVIGTLPFKKGSFEAAAATVHPVVAFAIEMGNPKRDFWYTDGLLSQYFITYSKWKTDVYLHFFDPIVGNSGDALRLQCEQMINAKLVEFQKNWK
jgi:1-acyl-sn-glycerol-3-phosphate acyltransferase